MFECVHAMAHEWQSGDNLRCQSIPPTLFETGFHSPVLAGLHTCRDPPVSTSHLTRGALILQMSGSYMGSGCLNSHTCAYVLSALSTKTAICSFNKGWWHML